MVTEWKGAFEQNNMDDAPVIRMGQFRPNVRADGITLADILRLENEIKSNKIIIIEGGKDEPRVVRKEKKANQKKVIHKDSTAAYDLEIQIPDRSYFSSQLGYYFALMSQFIHAKWLLNDPMPLSEHNETIDSRLRMAKEALNDVYMGLKAQRAAIVRLEKEKVMSVAFKKKCDAMIQTYESRFALVEKALVEVERQVRSEANTEALLANLTKHNAVLESTTGWLITEDALQVLELSEGSQILAQDLFGSELTSTATRLSKQGVRVLTRFDSVKKK